MSYPECICLCGYMGAGKTETGRRLAERLQYRFVDLDSLVEAWQGRTIAEIFATDGEPYFRKLEVEAGLQVLESPRVVIALGGGALTTETLRSAVSESAVLVYLKASAGTLFERVQGIHTRPLLAVTNGLDAFRSQFDALMKTRAPQYEKAQLTVTTDGLTVEQTVDSIMHSLQGTARHVP